MQFADPMKLQGKQLHFITHIHQTSMLVTNIYSLTEVCSSSSGVSTVEM